MFKPSSNVEPIEVLTQPEQRRRRSVEEKLAIVRETFEPGVSLPPKNEFLAERLNSARRVKKISRTTRARYTLEFKLEAVRLVKAGQSVAAVAATLDVPAQSISNWVKAEQEGKLGGAWTKPVSPEQMELSRLRAEVARLKMERDILKKACAYFAKDSR